MSRTKLYRAIIITIVVLLQAAPLFAQFDFPAIGARSAGMAGSYLALDDAESALNNIASGCNLTNRTMVLDLYQPLAIQGIAYRNGGIVLPSKKGVWSALYSHYGNSDYYEQQIQTAYASKITHRFAFGAALTYLNSGTSDTYYQTLHLLTGSVALQYRITEQIRTGCKIFIHRTIKLNSTENVSLTHLFDIAVVYTPTEKFLLIASYEQYRQRYRDLRLGIECKILGPVALRCGIATNPQLWSIGMGYNGKRFAGDIAVQNHEGIGNSLHLSTHYNL